MTDTNPTRLRITWMDLGRKAVEKPDPRYPDGVDCDITGGSPVNCMARLPYPAPRCGRHIITCTVCGIRVLVTAAGRRDDPRTVKVACRPLVALAPSQEVL